MLRTTPSPATPGLIGPPWCRSRARVTYARRLNKTINAAAAARAGLKMFMKSNTRSTKFFLETLNRNQGHKLRVQASSRSPQAQGSWNQGTSGSSQAPGNRPQAHKYFFCA